MVLGQPTEVLERTGRQKKVKVCLNVTCMNTIASLEMGGDAIREAQRSQRGGAYAQCSLHTTRNLLRDASITAAELALNSEGGDIRFPFWEAVLSPLLREDEEFVIFNPTRVSSRRPRF